MKTENDHATTSGNPHPMKKKGYWLHFIFMVGGSWILSALWLVILLRRSEWLWQNYLDVVVPSIAFLLVMMMLFSSRSRGKTILVVASLPLLTIILYSLYITFGREGAGHPSVKILPMESEELRVTILGDFGRASPASYALGDQIGKAEPTPYDAIFLLGDILYGHQPHEDSVRDRVYLPLAKAFADDTPVFAVLGSHDIKGGYAKNLLAQANLGMDSQRYYELRTEGDLASFFILDSERFPRDPQQYRWLLEAVRDSPARWKVLLCYGPPEASAIHHEKDLDLRRMLDPLLMAGKIQMVVSGKNHLYERRVSPGIATVFITIGSSGRVSNEALPPDPLRLAENIDAEARLSLTINQDSIQLTATDFTGKDFDHFVMAEE